MTASTLPAPIAQVDFMGTDVRIVLDADATGDAFGLTDMTLPAGHMPPLHLHGHEDESFYVLDGELTLFTPGEQIVLGPGERCTAPKGIPHTYRVGDRGARCLVTSWPAGFEAFVAEVAAEGATDPVRVTEIAATYEIEILGPPGTMPA